MPHSSVNASLSPQCSKLAVGLMSCTSTAVSPSRANFEFGGEGECSVIVSLYRTSTPSPVFTFGGPPGRPSSPPLDSPRSP
eukprot:2548379-Pyramimonas_sp.AAC.1